VIEKPESYVLEDPRPIAREAPYTFFLPAAERLAALKPGDRAYLEFIAVPARTKWLSERMWVEVTAAEGDRLRGVLYDEPDDIPGLSKGAIIHFERWHALQLEFADPSVAASFGDGEREYWERCKVDRLVIDGELRVGHVFREAPDTGNEGGPSSDSGWRIRADTRGCSDEQIEQREVLYVALGAVLNRDDSWLHLIDAPAGSAFERDFERDIYAPAPG